MTDDDVKNCYTHQSQETEWLTPRLDASLVSDNRYSFAPNGKEAFFKAANEVITYVNPRDKFQIQLAERVLAYATYYIKYMNN